MPELMITPTPTPLPGNAGNANALSQSDAPGRSGDSPKTDTESSPAAPFASVLKSRMDKQATADETNGSVADTAVTAPTETPAITIAVDLSGLLPMLGITPGAPATATVEAADIAAEAGAAAGLQLVPAVPALPVLPGVQPAAVAAQPETAAATAPAQAAQIAAIDPGSRKPQVDAERGLHAPATGPGTEPGARMPGKIELEAAINADGGRKGGEIAQPEAAVGDFRALMERAANMAPGTANAASHASSGPALRIDTPLGQNGWHEEMGQKLTWMAGNNRQQAELVLTPPQLGRVEVSLTMNGDQATAIFTSPNPAVREALEASLQRLREVLADAGVSLGQTQVGSESPSQSSRQEERGFGTEQGVRYAATVALPGTSATTRSGAGRGMVDVFA
jgi:flagellar hook-length control protein FliK